MLEAGLVRAKNTAEILTKNVGLYSIACVMYMLVGYTIMYPGEFEGGFLQSLSTIGSGLLTSADNSSEAVLGGDSYYSNLSDFFFSGRFRRHGHVDRFRRRCRTDEAVVVFPCLPLC